MEEFAKVFFKPTAKQTLPDHARMNACGDPAMTRFKQLDEEAQDELRKSNRLTHA